MLIQLPKILITFNMIQDENFPQIGETINQYEFESLLAETSESTKIYSAYSSILKCQVIIKVISLEEADLHYADTEAVILTEVNSPYVLNAIDVFDINYKKNISLKSNLLRFIVTPKIGDQDAYTYSKKSENVKFIIYDTLKALQYLHGMNIIHRDVKPENIFIRCIDDKKGSYFSDDSDTELDLNMSVNSFLNNFSSPRPIRAVLGDLGLAKQYPKNQEMYETQEFVGTLQYCSPQVAANVPYNESTDIWSLGATAYYLIYDQYPFKHSDSDPMVDIKSIVHCDYSFPSNDDVPLEAKDLISRMLQFSQKDRISVEDALHHVWFKDITEDW